MAKAGDSEERGAKSPSTKGERRSSRSRSPKRSRSRRRRRDDKDKDKDKDRRRRRSRSRSRGRRDRDRDRSRRGSRDRDRDRDRSRRGSRGRDRTPERGRSKSPAMNADKEAARQERLKNIDDYTVFVSGIHPKVKDRDLFEFFSYVGQVEDIQVVKDQRTRKSKGLSYVEFSEKDSVHKAIALTGQLVCGYPITVAIVQQDLQKKSAVVASVDDGMRLQVSGLHPSTTSEDLKGLFEPFGDVEFLEVQPDPITGGAKFMGYVQYKRRNDAVTAIEALNDFEITEGFTMKVAAVEGEEQKADTAGDAAPPTGLDDANTGGFAMTSAGRAQLMQRLARGAVETPGIAPPIPPPQAPAAPAPVLPDVPRMQPTTCVVVKNMFSPQTQTDPEWWLDIQEDAEEEASKCGRIEHIHVDRENPAGVVYMRFADVNAAIGTQKMFHGRWFASRQIQADFVNESVYMAQFA